eukprot:m.33668 g.33668  ORF g.33668 m.33668 type:complete len:866 (+) comp9654_c0_seq1:58-2655(+)
MAYYKKDEDDGGNPFVHLEKTAVLQEARAFNDMPIKVRKCIGTLTKILCLIHQGETFGTREATETFFAMTKLFQNPNPTLRRMVYLCVKAMSTISEDVIMVTSSLMKDTTNGDAAFRGPAIRALCTITDATTLQSLERFLKQAIVDRNPSVSSASLVSALHLLAQGQDVVRRWVNEVQRAASDNSHMAQYHALGLLYAIKEKDKLAVQKLVLTHIKSHATRSSPYATCLLIRYCSKALEQDPDNADSAFVDFLNAGLTSGSEMVVYEAARAIVNRRNASTQEVNRAVQVLKVFLTSPRPVLRFAAVKTLNKVSISHPAALKACILDMETLITDSNRSVATLAITTLLKTGSESSVDRLMKQITSFVHEISDEFKTVVVDSVRALCLKFPQKYPVLMNFLSTALRDEGGLEYKTAIVKTISSIVENVPEAREAGLAHLCEYIEDCEFPSLLTAILDMIGAQGPETAHPNKYIRFIYNRLILENSIVRAAAVNALQQFGAKCEALRPSVIVLLRRSIQDGDDEVRDRVVLALDALENDQSAFLLDYTPLSLPSLERTLQSYIASPSTTPFDIKAVPVEVAAPPSKDLVDELMDVGADAAPAADNRLETETRLHAIEEFSGLGPLFKTSPPVMLTESETEYLVQAKKHIFQNHVVFEYVITNTLKDQILQDAQVVMEGGEQEVDEDEVVIVAADKVMPDEPSSAYVCFPLDPTIASQEFQTRLDFMVRDCDPETGEVDEEAYEDTYALEDITLGVSDYIVALPKPNFAAAWSKLEDKCELEEVLVLEDDTLEDSVQKVQKLLGLAFCEKSGQVQPDSSRHTVYLSGTFVGGHDVLVKVAMVFDQGVNMDIAIRSEDEQVAECVLTSLG